MKAVNQFERAYRAWPILVEAAADRHPITYGQLARQLCIHHRPVRFVLAKIQAHCQEQDLPPLTILVEDSKGNVGAGFTAWAHDNIKAGRKTVYAGPWASIRNPFEFAANGTTPEQIADALAENNTKSAQDRLANVRVRGIAQAIFRRAILRLYGSRCAISGDGGVPLLQAAHIIPWSEATSAERTNPANGILLSQTYHRMFDLDWIRITTGRRVSVRWPVIQNKGLSPSQCAALRGIDGQQIGLPADKRLWPNPNLLRRRYASSKLRKKAKELLADAID